MSEEEINFCKKSGLKLEELQNYLLNRNPDGKKFICAYWLRGTCIFPAKYCHQAHGFKDLDYTIESDRVRRPFYSEDVRKRPEYFKLERSFHVLHEAQHRPFIKNEIRRYIENQGKHYDPNHVYSLNDLFVNKKIRSIVLTYLLLEELIEFFKYIFTTLKVPVAKALLVLELQRVGFCQIGLPLKNYFLIGGKTYKPGTILYHLMSYGECFATDLIVPGFQMTGDQAEMPPDVNQVQQPEEEAEEDEGAPEEEEVEKKNNDLTTFFIHVRDKEQTFKNFVQIFHKVMENIISNPPEQEIDYETILIFTDRYVDQHNQNVYPNIDEMVPHLENALKSKGIPFDDFYEAECREGYPSVNLLKNRGFDQCGVGIKILTANYNEEQKACIEGYLKRPFKKYFLCRYWWRGLCVFKKEDCRLAHGLADLQLQDKLIAHNDEELKEIQNPLRCNEKALIRVRTYRVLYYYQFEMFKQGLINKNQLKTVFEIDSVKEYRDSIRDAIRTYLVEGFYKMISKGQPLPQQYLISVFEAHGFFQTDLSEAKLFKLLICNNICFEREFEVKSLGAYQHLFDIVTEYREKKRQLQTQEEEQKQDKDVPKLNVKKQKALQKCNMLIPYKDYQLIENYYVELVTRIFMDEIKKLLDTSKSLEFLPLNENIIKRNINRLDVQIDQPGFYNFLRCGEKKLSISQFTRDLILPSLSILFKQQSDLDSRWQDLSDLIQNSPYDFMQLDDNMEAVESFILEVLAEKVQKGKRLFNVDKFLKLCEIKFQSQMSTLGTNDRLKIFLRDYLVYGERVNPLYKNYYLQTYGQGLYIIINPINQLQTEYKQKEKVCKCGQTNLIPNDLTKMRFHDEDALLILKKEAEQSGFLEPEVRNTVVVDNEAKLEFAMKVIQKSNFVGVDFEGNLNKGYLWLAQIGIRYKGSLCINIQVTERLILILDFMQAQNTDNQVLYAQLLSFLQDTMQDIQIRKVFHDCRKDSLALHLNGICTKNATDTSLSYSIVQQITYFENWKNSQKQVVPSTNPQVLLKQQQEKEREYIDNLYSLDLKRQYKIYHNSNNHLQMMC